MKEIAEIRYTVTADRLMRLYYARYKVNYKEFSQEIYDSRSDSEKEYSDVFFDDRVVSQNIVKDEIEGIYNEKYWKQIRNNDYSSFGYQKVLLENKIKFDSILNQITCKKIRW